MLLPREPKIRARRLKLRVWEPKIKARRLKLKVWEPRIKARRLKFGLGNLKLRPGGLN